MIDLPLIWGAIIALGVLIYVVLDGFDLGVGILFPWAPLKAQRDIMMNSVAPVWDGNETWLVLGGTALFGAFPAAYAALLPAFYMPLIIMLLALIFRGVAFEFRFRDGRHRGGWDLAFTSGSVVATFAQGVVLGAFIQGVEVHNGAFAGGSLDWLTAFSLMTGCGLVAGYALLGATWLILKTEGALQEMAYAWARRLLLLVLFFVALVSLWTPLEHEAIAARWFTWPNLLWLSPVPIVTAATAGGLWLGLERRRELTPFLLAIALFALSYLGLGVSLWPYVVPRALTIWQAASPAGSQIFILVGVLLLLPLIIGYTAYAYRVFRGKVRSGEGYH
ncbi:MAG TPA: cytochrome d ubiquinol oxidase subunit II [Alphaproteobacteria bacterium]|nr:cytochrome d ubiquinol oxidase subunit II [Alphaproteobacteria bacterium]